MIQLRLKIIQTLADNACALNCRNNLANHCQCRLCNNVTKFNCLIQTGYPCLDSEIILYCLRETVDGFFLSMNKDDFCWFLCHRRNPLQKSGSVSMSTEAFDILDPCVDRDLLVKYADLLRAINNPASKRADGLVTDKNNR